MLIIKKNIKLFILLLCSITSTVYAQEQNVGLKASVSKNKLGVNQRLRIQYTINKQGADNFQPPNFQNFKIIGGPSNSVSQSWINGKVSFSQSYTYILQPKRMGEFTLPPASIEIDGKTIKSNTLRIIVSKAVDLPKNPNDPNYIASQSIHLVAEISNANPYVGEGVYLEYRLYLNRKVGIRETAITESPQYNGFWTQEIKNNNISLKSGKYNGENYNYAVLHKALLIPTKSGKLTIEPMKMDIVVRVPTGRADFFGNVIERQVRKEFTSSTKTIQVKPLPIQNKPDNFSGAVGEFSFDVALSKQILKANESSQIKIAVTGKGNLKLFELPKIETPEELEIYQPERKEKITITTTGIKGSIGDNYTVVPQFKGKYKIPAVSFSYFNPKQRVYQTITSDDLYVDVLEGKEPIQTNDPTITKQEVKIKGDNFRYIQTSYNLVSIGDTNFFRSNLFYFLSILPILIIPILILVYKKKQERANDILGNKQRKADRLAKKYLSAASKQLGNKEAFYEALERALHNYLKAKLKVETSEISRDKITAILESNNVNSSSIAQFIDVLNDCDFARYTPIDSVQMKEELEKAKLIITELDKQLS